MSIDTPLANKNIIEKKLFRKTHESLSAEDMEVLMVLEKLKKDLNFVHNNLDHVTNPVLIDSYIYEIKSLHMKYQFYLQLCKDKGLASSLFA